MLKLYVQAINLKTEFSSKIGKFVAAEDGATAIEYGLIAALIAVVIIGVLGTIGTNLTAKFTAVANAL
jgi:pilus assembly protein Flp/PilA